MYSNGDRMHFAMTRTNVGIASYIHYRISCALAIYKIIYTNPVLVVAPAENGHLRRRRPPCRCTAAQVLTILRAYEKSF